MPFFQQPNTDQRSILRAQITKIDRERREVWGVAAVEEPDRAGEILDYETSKPHFERWSQSFVDATGGKSKGNLRAMHTKIAAGVLTAFAANDALKRFEVCAKVVDDQEWRKCEEGVYTGFSIGGDYVGQKWEDPVYKGFKRYTGAPAELSLVDAPCIPGATFEVVKDASGTKELRKFACVRIDELAKSLATKMVKGGIETLNDAKLDELLVKAAEKKTKSVGGKELPASAFAFVGDPEKTETWKLPVHDASHAQNAMARFNQTEGIPPEKKHEVAQHIISAAHKHGIEVKTFAQKAVIVCFGNALLKRGIIDDETFNGAFEKGDAAHDPSNGEFASSAGAGDKMQREVPGGGKRAVAGKKIPTLNTTDYKRTKVGNIKSFEALPLAKSMWDVGRLADILCSLSWMESSLRDEAIYENDDSKIPAQLLAALQPLKQIFIDLATEEVNELIRESQAGSDEEVVLELGVIAGGLFKLGTGNSGAVKLDIFALAKAS